MSCHSPSLSHHTLVLKMLAEEEQPSPAELQRQAGPVTLPAVPLRAGGCSSAGLCASLLAASSKPGAAFLWHYEAFGCNHAVVVQMTRVKVAACEQYSTCAECLAAADAYCGWCTMETR